MSEHQAIRAAAAVLIASMSAGAAAADAIPACDGQPAFAALDFWVGDWDVFVGTQKVGEDRVQKTLNGCAITESWAAAGGGEGFSLFYVDPADLRWRQVWVTGRALAPGGVKEKHLVETLPHGSLRFQGTVRDTAGRTWLDRTTLTPLPDGTVRQRIEISRDGGETREATFDAVYRQRSGQVPGCRLGHANNARTV